MIFIKNWHKWKKTWFQDLSIQNRVKILFLDQKILIKMCFWPFFSLLSYNYRFPTNMSINSRKLGIILFLWVPTVACSGMCNSVNNYPIITYFISFESKLSALQHSIITKSRAEHPFSSSGHFNCFLYTLFATKFPSYSLQCSTPFLPNHTIKI